MNIENKIDFVNNFDYTIIENYIKSQDYTSLPLTITNSDVRDILTLIDERYNLDCINDFKNKKINDLIINAFRELPEKNINIYHKDLYLLELRNFYPCVFTNYYLNNQIDYNESLFLLYALLYNFHLRNINNSDKDIQYVARVFMNSYYRIIYRYLENFYPNIILSQIISALSDDLIYCNVDNIFIKNVECLEKINHIIKNYEFNLYEVKYIFTTSLFNIFYYIKKNDEFCFIHSNHIRNETMLDNVKKKFETMLRKEKIETLLKNG